MFLIVEIDKGGYIRTCSHPRTIIHRETRSLDLTHVVKKTLVDAQQLIVCDEQAILELSKDGGGKALWMRDDQRPLWEPRLRVWAGCYGSWPVMKWAA